MKKNGRVIAMIFLIVVTSVIFLFSCGTPTYVLFSGIDIVPDSNDSSFRISCSTISGNLLDTYVSEGIGIVLLYSESNESDSTQITNTVNYLNNFFNTEEKGVVRLAYNSETGLVCTYTASDIEIPVYAMKCARVSNFETAYAYCANLSAEFIKEESNRIYIKQDSSGSLYLLSSDTENVDDEATGLISKIQWPTLTDKEFSSINLYGAIVFQSTGSGGKEVFNNIYWTDFEYLGTFTK